MRRMTKSLARTAARRFARSQTPAARFVDRMCRTYRFYHAGIDGGFEEDGEGAIVEAVLGGAGGKNRVVFDVGANVGEWTQLIGERADVHCFEIGEAAQAELESRFAGSGRVTINRAGLGERDGQMAYKDYGDRSTVNTLVTDAVFHDSSLEFSMRSARVFRGDTYCTENDIEKIDLLKIDTEGFDFSVLKGFESFLKSNRIDVIQFEYGYNNAEAGALMRDIYRYLNDLGYAVGPLSCYGVAFQDFTPTLNNFESGPNFVAALPKFVGRLERFV